MNEDVRADIMAACRVLSHFGMVRAFGYVSARLQPAGSIVICRPWPDGDAAILQANGMLTVGGSVPEACVKALFLEETATAQLMARAAGLTVRSFSPETAARRRGMDHPNEPVRAWEWYLAAASGTG